MTSQEMQDELGDTDVESTAREIMTAIDDAFGCETAADVLANLREAQKACDRCKAEIATALKRFQVTTLAGG